VEVKLSVFKFLHKSSIIEFFFSFPMSVMNVFIGPYFRIKCSSIALSTVFALWFGKGIVTRYFVKSQINVTAYSFPSSNLGMDLLCPQISYRKPFVGFQL